MRAAARAARLADAVAGARLEPRLVDDLAILSSPSRGLDGAAIYRMALADVDSAGAGAEPLRPVSRPKPPVPRPILSSE